MSSSSRQGGTARIATECSGMDETSGLWTARKKGQVLQYIDNLLNKHKRKQKNKEAQNMDPTVTAEREV